MSRIPLPADLPRSTEAPHPFNLSSADLVLRTADSIDFRVHSQVLALASPFFASMLALPQPTYTAASSSTDDAANSRSGINPIIPVSEDSTTLELLLRLVYPVMKTHTEIEDPPAIVPVLLAATKYDMELPVQMLSQQLTVIIPKSPLQTWAAACRTGQEVVARRAAEALKASWTYSGIEALSFMEGLGDMAGISAGDYYRLKLFLSGAAVPTLLSPTGSEDGTESTSLCTVKFSTDIPGADLECQPSAARGPTAPFFAHQSVLSCQSSHLKTQILDLRRAALSSAGMKPVVLQFAEEPEVVSALLSACYDETPLPCVLPLLGQLLVSSRKYKMARVTHRAGQTWDEAAALRPLEAYFVALDCGLHEHAQAAAKNVLAGPIASSYVSIMEKAPALAHHNLLIYYDACYEIVRQQLDRGTRQIPTSLTHTCTQTDSYYDDDYHRPTTARHKASRYNPTAVSHSASIPTTGVVGPLEKIAKKARIGPRESLRKALRDAVTQAGSDDSSSLPIFAKTLIQCVVSVPDEIDEALRDVKVTIV